MEVTLFALDGTLGARTSIHMALPKVTIPGDEGMQAIILLGIGVNDAAVR